MMSEDKNADAPTQPEQLFERLADAGITFSCHEHPALRTVEDAKQYREGMDGVHVKNLFLRDRKKRNHLVVMQEDRDVDLKALPALIGSDRLSFASADRLWEFLGIRPGAVSPLALINDAEHRVNLSLDASLMAADRLYFHPLTNEKTIGISVADLQAFLALSGHKPRLIQL